MGVEPRAKGTKKGLEAVRDRDRTSSVLPGQSSEWEGPVQFS